MRAILLHNPTAGKSRFGRNRLMAALRRAGYDPFYQSVSDDHYADVLEHPADLVVIAGGDGTVGKVAPFLLDRDLPIGLLPTGTANNIARTLGLAGPPEQIIEGWPTAQRRAFDVGIARGPWGILHFLETLGIGLFAQVMASAPG